MINLNEYHKKRYIKTEFFVRDVSMLVEELGVLNFILFPREMVLTNYSKVNIKLVNANGEYLDMTLESTVTMDELIVATNMVKDNKIVDLVIWSAGDDTYAIFTAEEIDALGGIVLLCSEVIAMEYYRKLFYNILYSNDELRRLCSSNPCIKKNTHITPNDIYQILMMNDFVLPDKLVDQISDKLDTEDDDERETPLDVYKLLDLNEFAINDSLMELISLTIARNPILTHNEVVSMVRSIANDYPMSPKQINITRYTVSIDVYDDIRTIRYVETECINEHNPKCDSRNN